MFTDNKKESVQFNEPAPVRRLIRGLGLTSHPKDVMAKSEINFMSLYVTVWATAMTAAQEVAAGDRTSDLLIRKQAS